MCNCNNNKIQPAIITPVLAAGSVASPYDWRINIVQPLCRKTCAANTPVFNPQFTLVGVSQTGTNKFNATIRVEGCISYVARGCGCNGCENQPLSQEFTIPFDFTGTNPVVSIAQDATANAMSVSGCQTCSRLFVSETPLTLTVAAAAAA